MIYLIVFGLFIYTWIRISNLEKKIINNKNDTPQKIEVQNQPEASQAPQPAAPTQASQVPQSPINTPAEVPPPVAHPQQPATSDTEFNLGSRVFTAVGVIAVLLGVGFFLRYAFANDLISQGMRVFLGCAFGVVLIALGHYLRKKYSVYGLTLVGAGFGVFYLSIYAAYSFYQLIDPVSAFLFLFLITAASVALAIWYDSKALIGYSFAGAFIMPFLLPFSQDINLLFIYLLIVNAGALLVARFKVWPILTVASLAGTSLIYLKWILGPTYSDVLFFPTIAYCTVIFLSYFTTSLLNFVYRDRNYEGIDALLLYATPIVYFVLNIYIMKNQDNVALLAAIIGIFNFVMFCVIRFSFGDIGELKKFSEGIFLMAAAFVAAAVGLHFGGSTITISWAIQAAAMALVGYVIRSRLNMIASIFLSVLVGLKMLFFGLALPIGSVAIFNGRSGTLFVVALMYAAIWAVFHLDLSKGTNVIDTKEESDMSKYVVIFGLFSTIFLWINVEAHDFLSEYMLYLPIMWLVYSLVMTSLSFFLKEKLPRYLSYILVIVAFIVMVFSQWNLDITTHPLIFNIRVLTALVFAGVSVLFVKFIDVHSEQLAAGEKEFKVVFLLLANIAVLWAFTLEILSYFNTQLSVASGDSLISIENTKRVSLSIFWLLYALGGLAVGIFKRSLFARYFSIFLFGVSIFKIFLYDTANLSDVYRFVSFIVLGIILLIVGFSYYRFKDRITEFVTIAK